MIRYRVAEHKIGDPDWGRIESAADEAHGYIWAVFPIL